jgi:hypothetical protein
MIEQDIYNKRIIELMKKKTILIETLDKLLTLAHKPRTNQKEDAGILPSKPNLLEAGRSN